MPEEAPIELNGSLTLGELTRFHYFHVWRKAWKPGLISALLVAVTAIALGSYADESGVSRMRIVFAAFLVAWIAFVILAPYRLARKMWAERKYLAEPLRQIFTLQTIERSGATISSKLAWTVVREIYETKTLFLLYIAPNQAIIVPKSFFPDHATMQAWKQLAKSQTPRFTENHFIGRWC